MKKRMGAISSGERFGSLTILSQAGINHRRGRTYRCRCDCGRETVASGENLRRGDAKTCGCRGNRYAPQKVGKRPADPAKLKMYEVWRRMISRCHNPKSSDFHHYGGRGIAVCSRWFDLENFVSDMGIPAKGLELDRIDNSKDYSPDNCQWVSRTEQVRNRRVTFRVEYQGRVMAVAEVAEITGADPNLLRGRLRLGWSVEKALREPKYRSRFP